ncbi:MAG: hypothetical protein OEQ74_02150 [Gammaproteobacteria bacterium]|nr:hypothetical protein [Gammaproteobacteria bacterium]
MRHALAPEMPLVHLDPEVLASYVDGREVESEQLYHLKTCELCRTRASDARLLRALLVGNREEGVGTTVPLDAATIAGYHDQSLPADQMAAVDRRLLADDNVLLELIELRIGLHAGLRAATPQTHLVSRIAARFSTGQSKQSLRIASLGTMIIDWNSELPAFHYHPATPENVASITAAQDNPTINNSGSFPAPVAKREVDLHAGRNTLRLRIVPGNKLELFVFDEQNFRPANGISITFEPEKGVGRQTATRNSGIVAFELSPGPARLLIDAGDRWVLELR